MGGALVIAQSLSRLQVGNTRSIAGRVQRPQNLLGESLARHSFLSSHYCGGDVLKMRRMNGCLAQRSYLPTSSYFTQVLQIALSLMRDPHPNRPNIAISCTFPNSLRYAALSATFLLEK